MSTANLTIINYKSSFTTSINNKALKVEKQDTKD